MPPKDTRQKLRDEMDKLALAMATEANKVRTDQGVKLDVLKHVTQYLSMANRQPEESVGADIVEFQRRIARTNPVGGADPGDAAERGADESEHDEDDESSPDDTAPPGEVAA